jgi:hypothetical protein
MRDAIGYIRVSSDEAADSGSSAFSGFVDILMEMSCCRRARSRDHRRRICAYSRYAATASATGSPGTNPCSGPATGRARKRSKRGGSVGQYTCAGWVRVGGGSESWLESKTGTN